MTKTTDLMAYTYEEADRIDSYLSSLKMKVSMISIDVNDIRASGEKAAVLGMIEGGHTYFGRMAAIAAQKEIKTHME